jgi:hypothetical protein
MADKDMTDEEVEQAFEVPFKFTRRPSPLPGDLRPLWRISVVLLLLKHCCRQARSSLRRLHVLNWAIRSKENQHLFLQVVERDRETTDFIVRFEPAFNRAISFAIGEHLISSKGDSVQITEKGSAYVAELEQQSTLLQEERNFVKTLGMRVTEAFIKQLFLDLDAP